MANPAGDASPAGFCVCRVEDPPIPMRAFVLSGGGNRGPLQVGALRALLQAGHRPEMIVGSSAGAINGAVLALHPTIGQVEVMAALWRTAGARRLISANPARAILNMARGKDHISGNAALRRYARSVFPPDRRTFGCLNLPLYVTIAHVATHTLYVYGDDPDADVIDAVLASAAVPGFFPPLRHKGEVFTDGGVVSNLPLRLAMSRGATEVWAIDLAYDIAHRRELKRNLAIVDHSVRPIMYAESIRELEAAAHNPNVTLHHVAIHDFQDVSLGDFSRADDMIAAGERTMRAYLADLRPNQVRRPKAFAHEDLPEGPPGSRPFILPS